MRISPLRFAAEVSTRFSLFSLTPSADFVGPPLPSFPLGTLLADFVGPLPTGLLSSTEQPDARKTNNVVVRNVHFSPAVISSTPANAVIFNGNSAKID